MLRITMTDGQITCRALEFTHTPQINSDLPPGTKIVFNNVPTRGGYPLISLFHSYLFFYLRTYLLLSPGVVNVLGGKVESLMEEWKIAQRKARGIVTDTGSADVPPAFVPVST